MVMQRRACHARMGHRESRLSPLHVLFDLILENNYYTRMKLDLTEDFTLLRSQEVIQ